MYRRLELAAQQVALIPLPTAKSGEPIIPQETLRDWSEVVKEHGRAANRREAMHAGDVADPDLSPASNTDGEGRTTGLP